MSARGWLWSQRHVVDSSILFSCSNVESHPSYDANERFGMGLNPALRCTSPFRKTGRVDVGYTANLWKRFMAQPLFGWRVPVGWESGLWTNNRPVPPPED